MIFDRNKSNLGAISLWFTKPPSQKSTFENVEPPNKPCKQPVHSPPSHVILKKEML